jgi:GTP-binding protein LepA
LTLHIHRFCIIAHIDHRSRLADRLRSGVLCGMTDQVLDSMDLVRKGVAIRPVCDELSPAWRGLRMNWVDFERLTGYEVSRALEACEGAVLVVDATQGIEAQTLANLYLALNADLEVLPVINKIDLASAQPDQVAADIQHLLGTPSQEILRISAKEGTNVQLVLEAIVAVPPWRRQRAAALTLRLALRLTKG